MFHNTLNYYQVPGKLNNKTENFVNSYCLDCEHKGRNVS